MGACSGALAVRRPGQRRGRGGSRKSPQGQPVRRALRLRRATDARGIAAVLPARRCQRNRRSTTGPARKATRGCARWNWPQPGSGTLNFGNGCAGAHLGRVQGRMSTSAMHNEASGRIELLQGTLDMLILRTLLFGPAHGHQIAKHIQRTTDDLLQVEHGSLYPALHRLERKGWIAAKWESAGKDLKREFKYYRLTPAGKKQLVAEESKWKQLTGAIAQIMWPAKEG